MNHAAQSFDSFDYRHPSISQTKQLQQLHLSHFGLILALAKYMLKISIEDSQTGRMLILEGKIIAPWTGELAQVACEDLANKLDGRELVIDLEGVTDISADGAEALYCLMLQGATFRGGGVFVKQVLKQLSQRGGRSDSL